MPKVKIKQETCGAVMPGTGKTEVVTPTVTHNERLGCECLKEEACQPLLPLIVNKQR